MTRSIASPRLPKSTSADAVNGAKATAAATVRDFTFLIFFIFISSLMISVEIVFTGNPKWFSCADPYPVI
jgi:hypothetical protein